MYHGTCGGGTWAVEVRFPNTLAPRNAVPRALRAPSSSPGRLPGLPRGDLWVRMLSQQAE